MRITRRTIEIGQIVEGYKNDNEEGVVGYNGKLNIRPAYQREFVYDDKKRNAVIDTIMKGFPLNVMYWSKNLDGTYELLDGQQRTISFCEFISGLKFSLSDETWWGSLPADKQDEILHYPLDIYICEGNDSERLDWFRTINIAGEKLTDQELRNANYTGPWLSDAKRRFSKTNCVAYLASGGSKTPLIGKSTIRQEFLETVLDWISDGHIEDYMKAHYKDENSDELWGYFQNVIDWVNSVFPNYRKEMKGLDWGKFYRTYKDNTYNAEELETEISNLMADDEVTCKKGVYEYVLSNGTAVNKLSLREFSEKDKRTAYERQRGICPIDGLHYEISEMEAHHILAWDNGGKTILENCVMVAKKNHKNIHNGLVTPTELREKRDAIVA